MKFLLACIACLAMGITNEALTSTRRRLRNSPYENACCKQTCCMLCLCKRLLPCYLYTQQSPEIDYSFSFCDIEHFRITQ